MPTSSSTQPYNLSQDSCFSRCPEIALRRLGKSTFLANQETDALYSLNELGGAVWTLLETPQTTSQIIQTLLFAFPNSNETLIREDINKLLFSLQRRNLIRST